MGSIGRCASRQVYNFNVPTFGPGVVYDVDQKVRTEQFRFFTEALKKDRLKKYVPQFVMEAEVSSECLLSHAWMWTCVMRMGMTRGRNRCLSWHPMRRNTSPSGVRLV